MVNQTFPSIPNPSTPEQALRELPPEADGTLARIQHAGPERVRRALLNLDRIRPDLDDSERLEMAIQSVEATRSKAFKPKASR